MKILNYITCKREHVELEETRDLEKNIKRLEVEHKLPNRKCNFTVQGDDNVALHRDI
jgi:hypothetical protein